MDVDLEEILTGEPLVADWLITDMLHTGQIICFAGDPGVGKSLLCYYLSFCVALGRPFLDFLAVKQGKVLYFDEENSPPDYKRYLQWVWFGLAQPDIAQLKKAIHIKSFSLLAEGHNRYPYMMEQTAKIQPDLIVIDTATPVCNIQDENNNAEASKAIAQFRKIKGVTKPECSMLILKHAKIDYLGTGIRTVRGAKTWIAETDGTIFHEKVRGRPPKNNLSNTVLFPSKPRAWSLKAPLKILPEWGNKMEGIKFTGNFINNEYLEKK